ncbi:hypothetical protein GRI89_16360 [Altererythrobacter salegens]|uniref:Uncharacterized protein n=1 Tax=Croceibacterium salegens TaxID=1737568 RepID=A0A6I4T1H5_9SPHN|nr:hypothetical protein [Croceibacterium salegens]MXO61117.1 hypothetical protein [Croceibacterium salegens]
MELFAIIIAAILGWQYAAFGARELKVMALVVAGWTAVTTAASVPYLTLTAFVFSLVFHTGVIAVPYALGAVARKLAGKKS